MDEKCVTRHRPLSGALHILGTFIVGGFAKQALLVRQPSGVPYHHFRLIIDDECGHLLDVYLL